MKNDVTLWRNGASNLSGECLQEWLNLIEGILHGAGHSMLVISREIRRPAELRRTSGRLTGKTLRIQIEPLPFSSALGFRNSEKV
jgi:hypothetical protein